MTAPLKLAGAAGRKIEDAKMVARGRIGEIRRVYQDASRDRRLLDAAELNQVVMLDIAALLEVETILGTIDISE